MTAEKQNEAKVSPMDENKENQADGGLGLESILYSSKYVTTVLPLLQRIDVKLRS